MLNSGDTITLSKWKGKKILIVNTASDCGYTGQYEELQSLYDQQKGKIMIIGFPANDFKKQEKASDQDIAAFCKKNYGVTFPMAAKISVVGSGMAPIYQWLTNKKYNNLKDSEVKWNFQKYLIDEKGHLVAVFDPRMKPNSPDIIAAIEK